MRNSEINMKLFKNSWLLPLSLVSLLLTGCAIYEEDQDCDPVYKIRFIYEWNMSGGDGFPAQVKSISLWVFDHETGKLVNKYSDAGTHLSQKGYLLELKDLKPGNYDFIAWGGLQGSESFSVPSDIVWENDLTCSLNTVLKDGRYTSDSLLSPLFYGSLDDLTVEDVRGEKIYTMPLIKDTNNITLSLQHTSEELLDFNDFSFYMTDINANLSSSNKLLSSPTVYYYPWSVTDTDIDLTGDVLNFIKIEISTSRLMADNNPYIYIFNEETGETVYQIPVVGWAKELRSIMNLDLTDQEYLDKEHEYNIMVQLIDDKNGWKATSIVINGYDLER